MFRFSQNYCLSKFKRTFAYVNTNEHIWESPTMYRTEVIKIENSDGINVPFIAFWVGLNHKIILIQNGSCDAAKNNVTSSVNCEIIQIAFRKFIFFLMFVAN